MTQETNQDYATINRHKRNKKEQRNSRNKRTKDPEDSFLDKIEVENLVQEHQKCVDDYNLRDCATNGRGQ